MVVDNPGILRRFKELEAQIGPKSDFGDVLEGHGIKITLLNESGNTGKVADWNLSKSILTVPGDYLKLEIGGQKFFVKRVSGFKEVSIYGYEEVQSIKAAKKALEGLDKVEVIDFELGFQDGKTTYFVSKWRNAVNLAAHLSFLEDTIYDDILENSEPAEQARNILVQRIAEIKRTLHPSGFKDVFPNNMLYDDKTDKIYVFDVHKTSKEKKV